MIQELLNYQAVDAGLRKIEQAIAGSEERKKYLQSKKFLETVDETLARLESRAAELNAFYAKINADSEKLRDALADYDHALEGSESREEIEYLARKAGELLDQLKKAEGDATRVSDEIDALVRNYGDLKKKTKAAQETYLEYGKKYKELKAGKAGEKEEIEKQLAELEKGIPAALMQRYAAKRADKIFPVLVKSNGLSCSACGMDISISEQSKLDNREITECENCRRLLYKE